MTGKYQKLEFNIARNSLKFLVRYFKITKLHIPFYICPTVKNALKQENVKIVFYHINDNFFPDCDFDCDNYILYPNYFGICSKNIKILAKQYKNLIVDNAQSFFMPPRGLASINSARKFFFQSIGLKDGSELYLKTNKKITTNIPKDNFEYEKKENNFEYNSFLKNEKRLEQESEIKLISQSSHKILKNIDLKKEKIKRLNAFWNFDKKYRNENRLKLELSEHDVPFVYPLLTFDEKLTAKILNNYDFILRYWTNLPESFNEYKFYKNLLPLPFE